MKFLRIDFKDYMVRAILRGDCPKTQTRRMAEGEKLRYPVGSVLCVREPWALPAHLDDVKGRDVPPSAWPSALAASSCPNGFPAGYGRVRAARFMPLWASSVLLRVNSSNIEDLHNINAIGAICEGVVPAAPPLGMAVSTTGRDGYAVEVEHGRLWAADPVEVFAMLWCWIRGKGAWDENPRVEVVSFTRVMGSEESAYRQAIFQKATESWVNRRIN